MTSRTSSRAALSVVAVSLVLAACGGGGGSSVGNSSTGGTTTPPPTGNTPAPSTTVDTTPGVWKGSIASTTTGQTASVVALTGHDGHSLWMTTDGRVWDGHVPTMGEHFDATFTGHMYEGAHFPDGTNHGSATMMVDHHSSTTTSGRYSGSGDAGSFDMGLSHMWNRTASLGAVAGVYTRSTSDGYTMTMTMDASGQLHGSDSAGCVFTGTVTVPDPNHNMYALDAQVTSCGALDGHYQGMGTLLDADAMQDWMTQMHPLEHGGHTHGGTMMGGSGMMGQNTVPTGQHNLFMFSMANEHAAIMDALAR